MAPLPTAVPSHPLGGPGGQALGASKASAAPPSEGPGLYVHVPFCRLRCPYCDFATAPFASTAARRFVDAVTVEARERAAALDPPAFATLFLGGGTPSLLPVNELADLVGALQASFHFAPDREFTIEANPEDVDAERAARWRSLGVNRVSLGVQSLDGSELSRLGRTHGVEGAVRAAGVIAERFDNWSCDLIYGMPGHEERSWERTLEQALDLDPPHLSAYHFTPEPGTPMGEAVRAGRLEVPGPDEVAALFERAETVLESAGYRHYEVSNYARPAAESRHNRRYWRRGSYLGLGPSAVSFWGEARWRNARDAGQYAARMLAGKGAVEDRENVSSQAERELVMLGLRLEEGVAWSDLECRGESGRPWIQAALSLGGEMLVTDEHGFRIPRARRGMTDAVVLELWQAAERVAGTAGPRGAAG